MKNFNVNIKNCLFCKLRHLRFTTILFSIYWVKTIHNFKNNCHEYYISSLNIFLCCLHFFMGIFSTYFNYNLFLSSISLFEAKFYILLIINSLISMLTLPLLVFKSSLYMKGIEITSRLEEFSSFMGYKLMEEENYRKILKRAKLYVQISLISLLVLYGVLPLEIYWFGVKNLFNRIFPTTICYSIAMMFTNIYVILTINVNFMKQIFYYLKRHLEVSYLKIVEVSTTKSLEDDLVILSRLYQAFWQNFMECFNYPKLYFLYLHIIIFFQNINFFSMIIDLFLLKDLFKDVPLHDFLYLCCCASVSLLYFCYPNPSLIEMEREVNFKYLNIFIRLIKLYLFKNFRWMI